MITKVTINLAEDQELEVFPDWEGETGEAVMIRVKDGVKIDDDEKNSFTMTPTEIIELSEATNLILKGQKA